MFKRHKEPADATIIEQRSIAHAPNLGLAAAGESVVEVRPATGAPFRTMVQTPHLAIDHSPPSKGQVVKVLLDSKHESAVFDQSDPGLSRRVRKQAREARFNEAQNAALGGAASGAPAAAGLEG